LFKYHELSYNETHSFVNEEIPVKNHAFNRIYFSITGFPRLGLWEPNKLVQMQSCILKDRPHVRRTVLSQNDNIRLIPIKLLTFQGLQNTIDTLKRRSESGEQVTLPCLSFALRVTVWQ